MTINKLRNGISTFLRFNLSESDVQFTTYETVEEDCYCRLRISYISEEGDEIPAFILIPDGDGPFGAVLVHHQHNSQRHFGKSEVCGLVGDPLQAFGPVLVKAGIVVLAPDSICFEDRRKNRDGTESSEKADVAQHYNEMCYRILQGDTLMRKVLSDSAQGISLLRAHPIIDPERVGILGHSYGGNTVLFHGALDERIRFGCSSGAACTYQHKMANQIGIEMAEVIPGFAHRYDVPDLVACFTPRPLLLVSAQEDAASYDANHIVDAVRQKHPEHHVDHYRYEGGHALTPERFDAVAQWLIQHANSTP